MFNLIFSDLFNVILNDFFDVIFSAIFCNQFNVFILFGWWRLDSDAKELEDTLARVARHVLEREADLADKVWCLFFVVSLLLLLMLFLLLLLLQLTLLLVVSINSGVAVTFLADLPFSTLVIDRIVIVCRVSTLRVSDRQLYVFWLFPDVTGVECILILVCWCVGVLVYCASRFSWKTPGHGVSKTVLFRSSHLCKRRGSFVCSREVLLIMAVPTDTCYYWRPTAAIA